jgi:conjugal transfer pilus assembly protein TraV
MPSLLKTLLSLVLCTHLSACAISKEHFDCPHGKGVGCRSITEVNKMVNKGQLGPTKTPDQPFGGSVLPAALLPEKLYQDVWVNRMPDRIIKIWFAPFQDEKGDLHEASTLHTVLKPGFWQMGA